MITDFHTHAFPDSLADRAIRTLLAETDEATAHLDGRLSSLLNSMDKAGIGRSVVCSIATKPEQFDKILEWSARIASPRIVPLPSVHPRDARAAEDVAKVAERGLRGIKLHPYYQDFFVDDPGVFPVYRRLEELRLMLVCHTGFDIAFPRTRRADPARIATVLDAFPNLLMITTHLGSWMDWEEVEKYLLGKPVYMEISYSLEMLPAERARSLIGRHPPEYVLFGTDSPWQDQSEALGRLRSLNLGKKVEEMILSGNAERILDSAAMPL